MFFSASKCCDKWCIIPHQKQFNKHILTILISKHKTLWPESCYILTVTKMSITSLSKVMECLDNVKICLLNRFWWRDSCNACHEIWQHHKTIFMATFQKSFIGPIHVIALFSLFSFAATHTMHKCKQTLFKCVFL